MMKTKIIGDIDITGSGSGDVVWVNAHAICVGRFGFNRTYEVVIYDGELNPRTVAAGAANSVVSWRSFADAIEAHYKITIPDDFIPARLKGAA